VGRGKLQRQFQHQRQVVLGGYTSNDKGNGRDTYYCSSGSENYPLYLLPAKNICKNICYNKENIKSEESAMKKYLILLFLLVFLLPVNNTRAETSERPSWLDQAKKAFPSARLFHVLNKETRARIQSVMSRLDRDKMADHQRLTTLGEGISATSLALQQHPNPGSPFYEALTRYRYYLTRDKLDVKERIEAARGQSTPKSGGSGRSSGGGGARVATSGGASSAGTYTVSSSGGGGGGGSWDGAREAICTYLSLPIVVQTSSKAQEIVVEMYDKEGKKMDGWFYRTILANGTSKEGVLFKQYKIRPNGQMLVPGKEYKYKVWAKAIGDDKGENRYLETDYLKPRCDTQTTLATLTFEKNTPTTQTTTEQEKKCYTYKEKGDDKERYYYGTLAQFTKHIISLGSEKYSELISETAGNCPDGVEVIKAEEEEKPGSTEEKDKPTEGAGEEGTQSADVAGAGSGPGAERAEGASGQGTGTTTEGKDTPKDDKESKEKSTTTATGGADTDKAKVEDEATKGLETDNKEISTTTTTTDNTLQQAVEELKNEIKLLRDDVAKLLSRAKPEDVQDAAEAIENKEEESSDAVKKLVEELGYLKETIVEANKALQEMVQTLKSNLTLPQLLTARNEGNPYAGLAANGIFNDAQDRGQTILEIEDQLAKAIRWAYIAWTAATVDNVETGTYEKIIAIAKINVQGADDKCSQLGSNCPAQLKEATAKVKEFITALPQTKTTRASQ